MKSVFPIFFFDQYTKHLYKWGEGHICNSTLDYINLTSNSYSVGYALHMNNGPVAISIASKNWPFAAIATHPEYRGCGYASEVLLRTINHFRLLGLTFSTWVAEDNLNSIGLLESCGLVCKSKAIRERSTGNYAALLYSSK